jgi:hypothetical protein
VFNLTEQQKAAVSEFTNVPAEYCGAIGGRYTFSFTPTAIGMVVEITDNVLKRQLDITDYDSW